MRGNIRALLSDNLIKISLLSSLILIIIQTILIVIFYNKFPPLIPFLNSRPWGAERLASSTLIFTIPAVFIIVYVINNFLASYFYKKNTLVARILSFNCLLLIFLGLSAYIQIVFLVF